MKIVKIENLEIPEIKVIKYDIFDDKRGHFTEAFRKSDFPFDIDIKEISESYSYKNVARGLHFQAEPYMGKLVRKILGTVVELILDIRIGSPTFGQLCIYTLQKNEWIWVPPGFAHGNIFPKRSIMEYLCTGEYNQKKEYCISLLDIAKQYPDNKILNPYPKHIISKKDKEGMTLEEWEKHKDAKKYFKYEDVKKHEKQN